MENTNMTLVAAILVVGLLVGSGVGYYMSEPVETTSQPQTQIPPTYNPQPVQPSGQTYATKEDVVGLYTLVYGAIGASLVAALASIVSLMQISRRLAG